MHIKIKRINMICIVSVFKNEGHAIREWLDHHIKEGVDTFFLTDNDSTDNYDIQDYIANGKVILRKDPKKYAQVEHLNYYLKEVKKYEWVIVIDMDEFIYSRRGFKTMKDYLNTVPKDIYLIKIPWKLFGSNGHIKQPKSIIQGFTRRKKHFKLIEAKSIARGDKILRITVHTIYVKDNTKGVHETMASTTTGPYHKRQFNEQTLESSHLHLNHYRIQSWNFYKTVKMSRGDVFKKSHTIRDKSFFKKNDTNDKLDTELKHKTY